MPTVPRHAVRQSALKHLVNTFFDGSREKVVSALLGTDSGSISDEELERIRHIIEKARKERR
jgi:predicted transcriptional regulator